MIEASPIVPLEAIDASAGVHQDGVIVEAPLTRNQFSKGLAWTSAFSFIAKIVFPLAGIFINRRLGPTILGIASTLQMTVQLSEVLREAGLTQTFISEPEMTDELLGAYTALKLVTSILPAILVVLISPLFVVYFHERDFGWSVPLIGLCLVMNGVGAVPTAQLLRKGEFRVQGMIGVIAGSVALAVTVVLVACGFGFVSLVVQMLVVCTVNLVLTLRAQPPCKPKFEWELMRSRAKKARALLGANVLNNIFLLTDIFVILKLVGPTASGLYNTAQNIAYKPLDLVLFPLSKTLMVAFGQTKDPGRLALIFWRSIKAIVLLLIPIYVFIACNASGVILLMLGEKFRGGIPVLEVLSLYLASRTFGSISGNALIPIQKHAWTLYPWCLALMVTGTGIFYVSLHPSLMGVVWAFTGGAMSVYLCIFSIAAYWLRPSRFALTDVAKAGIVLAATSAVMVGSMLIPLHPVLRMFLEIPCLTGFHLAATGLVFRKSPLVFLSWSGIKNLYQTL